MQTLKREFPRELQQSMTRVTFFAEARTKIESPVDTGFMRNSVSSQIGLFEAEIIVRANYAGFVHDGTRRQAPNPFVERARLQTIRFIRTRELKRFSNELKRKVQ